MQIELEIKNLDRVRSAYARAPQIIGHAIASALQKSAFAVEREAKLSATKLIYSRPKGPSNYVRTGALRNMIETVKYSRPSLYAVVRSKVEYSYYVHEGLGTSKSYGRRPYMEIGAKKARINGIFNTEILKGIKKIK